MATRFHTFQAAVAIAVMASLCTSQAALAGHGHGGGGTGGGSRSFSPFHNNLQSLKVVPNNTNRLITNTGKVSTVKKSSILSKFDDGTKLITTRPTDKVILTSPGPIKVGELLKKPGEVVVSRPIDKSKLGDVFKNPKGPLERAPIGDVVKDTKGGSGSTPTTPTTPTCPPHGKRGGSGVWFSLLSGLLSNVAAGGGGDSSGGGSSDGGQVAEAAPVEQPTVQTAAAEPTEPTDLEVLEIRLIDAGNLQENLGPAFRVTFRNSTGVNIARPFMVGVMASTSKLLTEGLPEATAEIAGMSAKAVLDADVRLPVTAIAMGHNADGEPVGFSWATASINIQHSVPETNWDNNTLTLNRKELLMVEN